MQRVRHRDAGGAVRRDDRCESRPGEHTEVTLRN
jgi:hypothetical protein